MYTGVIYALIKNHYRLPKLFIDKAADYAEKNFNDFTDAVMALEQMPEAERDKIIYFVLLLGPWGNVMHRHAALQMEMEWLKKAKER